MRYTDLKSNKGKHREISRVTKETAWEVQKIAWNFKSDKKKQLENSRVTKENILRSQELQRKTARYGEMAMTRGCIEDLPPVTVGSLVFLKFLEALVEAV